MVGVGVPPDDRSEDVRDAHVRYVRPHRFPGLVSRILRDERSVSGLEASESDREEHDADESEDEILIESEYDERKSEESRSEDHETPLFEDLANMLNPESLVDDGGKPHKCVHISHVRFLDAENVIHVHGQQRLVSRESECDEECAEEEDPQDLRVVMEVDRVHGFVLLAFLQGLLAFGEDDPDDQRIQEEERRRNQS